MFGPKDPAWSILTLPQVLIQIIDCFVSFPLQALPYNEGATNRAAGRGTIRGDGFIAQDDGGENLFAHRNDITDGQNLAEGDRVCYDEGWDHRKGKSCAINITVDTGGFGWGKGGGKGGFGCAHCGSTAHTVDTCWNRRSLNGLCVNKFLHFCKNTNYCNKMK